MLNDRQREQLSNSIWVINTVLKEQGLQGNSEMFSMSSLFLSKAITKFDENRGVKWTTYAYRSLTHYVRRMNAKECIRTSKLVSDNQLFYIKDNTDIEQEQYNKFVIEQIMGLLDDREKLIVEYKLKEIPIRELEEKLGITHQRISQIWNEIRQKVVANIDFEP